MIQSNYIPLQPPYRIIYSGGVVGLQIGTLIVVHELELSPNHRVFKDAVSNVRTSCLPVVSYVNKKFVDVNAKVAITYSGRYSEGVVWEKVSVTDVATLCFEGQTLVWDDFLTILEPMMMQCKDMETTRKTIGKVNRFCQSFTTLGGKLGFPGINELIPVDSYFTEKPEYGIELTFGSYEKDEREPISGYCSALGEELPFYAATEDPDEAFRILSRQKHFYERLLQELREDRKQVKITFLFSSEPNNDHSKELGALIDKLNALK